MDFNSPQPPMAALGTNPLSQIHTDLVEMTKAIGRLTTQVASSFPTFVAVPANSAAPGVAGQMSYDLNFFYIYAGTAWRRVAIVAF